MESHIFLLQLVLILVSARTMGEIAAYFKVPSVLGEVFAGIIIGPSVLGIVEPSNSIQLLSQIGIILLLFEVGLETDIGHLISAKNNAIVVALGGVLLPFIGGFCLSYYFFSYTTLVSLFIGSTLTATSIGITLRVLRDVQQHKSREANIILGAAILDDILGIVFLAMLYEFTLNGQVSLWNAGRVLLCISIFTCVAPFAVKFISRVIQKWNEKSEIPGIIPTMIVSLILFFSWIAHKLGAPELLGGFAAGLAISRHFFFPFGSKGTKETDFSSHVEEQLTPIIHLFTPIFFVAIGLSLDLYSIEWSSPSIWLTTISLCIVAVLGKMLSGVLMRNESRFTQFIVGIAMVPRGEVGLIFAHVGLTSGALTSDVYTSLVLVITMTTLLAPFLLRYTYDFHTT